MRKLHIVIWSFLISAFCSPCLFASPQVPDYLIYGKDTFVTYNLILEQYLQKRDPPNSEKLFGLSFRNNGGKEMSFNCWRGYQAIYKVDNDSFFLVDILKFYELSNGEIDKAASVKRMTEIFGEEVVNNRVYITWFTGDISFPLNNNVIRWDGVFYRIYEKETVIGIAAGKITKIEDVSNYEDDPKAIDRRDKAKVSDILFNQISKLKWKKIDDFCAEYYTVTIGKDGAIARVSMSSYQSPDSIEFYWDKWEYDSCITTIRRSLNNLKFDILKDKGKPISENIYIGLWYDTKKRRIQKHF